MSEYDFPNTINAAQKLCHARSRDQGKPHALVANGKGTKLYARRSFRGLLWSVVHLVRRDANQTLAKAIRSTSDNLSLLAQERSQLVALVEADGALGDFWKSHSVTEVRALAEKHLEVSYDFRPDCQQQEKLFEAIRWAESVVGVSDEESCDSEMLASFEGACSLENVARVSVKIEKAERFEAEWQALGGHDIASLGTLMRELLTVYAGDNEELIQKRDALQDGLGYVIRGEGFGWTGGKVVPELSFGPLVKIARDIGTKNREQIAEFSRFFDRLIAESNEGQRPMMQETASKIVGLARYFNRPDTTPVPENIPGIVAARLQDEAYLANAGLYQTDATRETDCVKIGGGTQRKCFPSSNPDGSWRFEMREVRIPYRHRRSYYRYCKAQDGTENLETFYTLSPTADSW